MDTFDRIIHIIVQKYYHLCTCLKVERNIFQDTQSSQQWHSTLQSWYTVQTWSRVPLKNPQYKHHLPMTLSKKQKTIGLDIPLVHHIWVLSIWSRYESHRISHLPRKYHVCFRIWVWMLLSLGNSKPKTKRKKGRSWLSMLKQWPSAYVVQAFLEDYSKLMQLKHVPYAMWWLVFSFPERVHHEKATVHYLFEGHKKISWSQ